jgi:hypothetical protein
MPTVAGLALAGLLAWIPIRHGRRRFFDTKADDAESTEGPIA